MRTLAIGLVLLAGGAAAADEYHYQGNPVGARAAAMGGAFTGLANDNAAAFYNPAGMILGTGTELSLSTSVYGVARDDIAGSQGVQPPTFLAFPSTFVVVKTPFWVKDNDPAPRHRYGLAVLVTDFTKIARQGTTGETTTLFKASDATTYAGLAYAYRLRPKLSLGASAYLISRAVTRFEQTSRTGGGSDVELDRREIEGSHLGAQLFAGALYRPTDRWSVGLTLRSPSFDLGGSLKLSQFSKRPGSPLEEQSTDQGVFTSQLPLSVICGVAWHAHERLLLSADLSLHAPTGAYTSLATPQMTETVDKGAVVNGALGLEVLLGWHVPLRAGFYTDRSARAGARSASLGDLDPDYVVFTGSIGYETDRTAIVAGGAFETGGLDTASFRLERQEIRWWVAASYRL